VEAGITRWGLLEIYVEYPTVSLEKLELSESSTKFDEPSGC
jgi:hypothetical protein